MPTFIKTGFWEKAQYGFKGWLNLDQLIEQIAGGGGGGTWGSITGVISNQTDLQTEFDTKADETDLQSHISNTSNPHSVTKSQVGLANADNTSDANKPVSTAQQTALNLKENTANKDASGGYVGKTLQSINFRNVANTFTSLFTNSNTAARTYTFQDRNGTIADDTDLATKYNVVNAAVALVDAASMDLTATKHTLASSSATRTFTISYTGDDITIEVTLSATSATYTFPATALCVSEGIASGDNLLALTGVSGDKYIIGIKKIGTAYYVVAKNFGQ